MGGNAFKELLPQGSFPRMPLELYSEVKSRIHTLLKTIFTLVGIPAEAPEKADYGDVDFVVFHGVNEPISCKAIEDLIGAVASIHMEGNRTSNYAIPSGESHVYHQIDIHICADENEYTRIMFYNSYGDLGMILGLLTNCCGLSIGRSGLKVRSSLFIAMILCMIPSFSRYLCMRVLLTLNRICYHLIFP